MIADDLVLDEWLLIRVDTLREISKDAKKYKSTLIELERAKIELDNQELRMRVLRLENRTLKNRKWWQSVMFWQGTVAAALGLVAGVVILSYATGEINGNRVQ